MGSRRGARADGEIEFLAPRTELFGAATVAGEPSETAEQHDFEADRPGRAGRRNVVLAFALGAVVGLVVAAASPWSSSSSRPPATTTPARGTSRNGVTSPTTATATRVGDGAAATTTEPGLVWVRLPDGTLQQVRADDPLVFGGTVVSVGDDPTGSTATDGTTPDTVAHLDSDSAKPAPGFVVDQPPDGYTLVAASDAPTGDLAVPVHVQIWNSLGFSRTTGSWMVVAVQQQAPAGDDIVAGGELVTVGGDPAVLTQTADHAWTLHFRPAANTRAIVIAFGMNKGLFLSNAAAAVGIALGDSLQQPWQGYIVDDDGVSLAFYGETNVPSMDLFVDPSGVRSQTTTYATIDRKVRFTISAHRYHIVDDALAELLIATGPDAAVPHTSSLGDAIGVVGTASEDPSITVAERQIDGRTVTIVGQLTTGQARDVLMHLRQTTVDEWAGMVRQGDIATSLAGDPTDPAQDVLIGQGTFEGGTSWRVTLSQDRRELLIDDGHSLLVRHLVAGTDVTTLLFRSTVGSWVVAISPRPVAGAALRLHPELGDTLTRSAFVTLPGQSWSGAAVGLAAGLAGTAEVEIAGTVVAGTSVAL